MADDAEDDLSVAASTTTIAGGAAWQSYVKVFLPLERSTEFTKDELTVEELVIREIGVEAWSAIPKDVQLNIMRGNAHEKERLKITADSAKKISDWRKKYQVDTEALTMGPWPDSERYFSAWPSRVAGTDVFGHPILYDRFATVNVAKMMALADEDFFKFRTQALEALSFVKKELSEKMGARIGKHIYILDLSGFDTTKHFTSATQKKMKPIMKMSADMFPETLWTTWIINAPATFRFVWSLVRTWLDPVIRAKIRMWGSTKSKWQAAMAECGIPLSSLPVEFGGSAPSEALEDVLARAAVAHSKSAQ